MFVPRDLPKIEAIKSLARLVPEVDPSAVQSCLTLLRVSGALHDALETHFGRFALLMLLRRNLESGLTPAELAEKAGVTRATITGLLDGLEQTGLVRREPHSDDRRKTVVHLTPDGIEHLQGIFPDHFRRVAALMEHLSEPEREELMRLLHKVDEGIPAVKNPEPPKKRQNAKTDD